MISFANTTGNLFNRLGKLGLIVKTCYAHQQTQANNFINTSTGVVGQFNSESDLQATIGNNYISTLTGPESSPKLAGTLAISTINRVVFRDNPQLNQSLTKVNLLASLNEVIRQMGAANASVLAMTITSSVSGTPATSFTGTGNGIIVASVKRDYDARVCENSYPEKLTIVCTNDSYSGSATTNNERFSVTGAGQQNDVFAFNWPLGSNAKKSVKASDGDTSFGSGNLLTNSGWASFTGNTPNNWTILTGTPGTNIIANGSIIYSSGNSLQLTGNGSTLIALEQQFNTSSGTLGQLSSLTQYAHNMFLRRDGTAAGNGILQVDLCDQNGNIVNDFAGTPNSYQVNLTTLTANYQAFNGVFRTPAVLPSSLFIRYHFPTGGALSNGRSVYLDKTCLTPITQIYTSGPSIAIFAGSIPFVLNDYGYCTIANSFGAGGTLSTWQVLANQFYGMQSYDLLLPSSVSPTISDSLIG